MNARRILDDAERSLRHAIAHGIDASDRTCALWLDRARHFLTVAAGESLEGRDLARAAHLADAIGRVAAAMTEITDMQRDPLHSLNADIAAEPLVDLAEEALASAAGDPWLSDALDRLATLRRTASDPVRVRIESIHHRAARVGRA